jgi:predicted PurR-regulated permease PerM
VIYPNPSAATRWGLSAVLLIATGFALHLGQMIFIPTIIALLFAAMLWPVVTWIHRDIPLPSLSFRDAFPWVVPCLFWWRIPWSLACTFVVVCVFGLTLLVPATGSVFVPRVLQSLSNPDKQQEYYADVRKKIGDLGVTLDPDYFPEKGIDSIIFRSVNQTLDPEKPFLVPFLWQTTQYGMSWILHWLLITFLLLFFLLEGPMLTRRVTEIFGPNETMQAKASMALRDMATQVRTYLVWRTIVNFGLAAVLGFVYQYVFHLSDPWTWALLAAVLCYIPYLGNILAGIPPVIDAFANSPSPWTAVGVLVFYIIVCTVEGYLIVPVVMGRPLQINATTVLLACLFWNLLWGLTGLFLAMPLMAAIKSTCAHVPGWEPWANLMSTEDPEPRVVPEPYVKQAEPVTGLTAEAVRGDNVGG